ncbi:MAG: GAF domain-containing protein [Nitrospirae bacterium]|nr:GAF domain-containing protein [Nitrospirota bacterium]
MFETINRERLEYRQSFGEILVNVAQIVNSTFDLKEILNRVTHLTADNLKKDACSVYLIRPEKKIICLEAAKGLRQESAGAACFPSGEGIIGLAAQELKPIAVEDISKESQFHNIHPAEAKDFLSILAVPILRDGKAEGVITLQTLKPHVYTEDEINILTIISHNISSAIRNAQLNKNAKIRFDELHAINEIGKAITSILSIDTLLPYICEEVSKLFNARGCILRLIEEGEVRIKASYGLPKEIEQAMSLKLGYGIAGWVAQAGEPLLVDDVSKMPENLRIPVIEATSVLCVPLKIGERLIGTLGLYDKKDNQRVTTFTQDDMELLVTFASASSIAIENARLYKTELEKEKTILSLYWEVIQTKEYLESIIDNSADAIITSDIEGLITSWNKGAEKIYGYTEDEVLGKFLPMVPQSLIEDEKKALQKIKHKETIRNIETHRQTKDGKLIEVSLTLSPILNSSGNVTGITGISRDVSERKRVEKELIRRNQELSRLFFINSVVRSTLELGRLLRMVLTVVTMSDGLGFNRAILFLVDESQNILKGEMGVRPANHEEAGKIWVSLEGKFLETIIDEIEGGSFRKDSYLDRISHNLTIDINEDCILSKCIREKKPINVPDVRNEPLVNPLLIQQFGTEAFGVVPLITRDKAIGLIWVDNLFTHRKIKDEDLHFLMGFTSHIASAIENARLFEEVSLAQSELQNIFESISDMLYFNDKDYNIRHVNQAVIAKIGKPEEEIVGKKCYEVFHGKNEPWEKCPHHKTMLTKKPYVEEVEDAHLGGTFVVSSSPIFDSAGNLAGTVHISRDITELHGLRNRVVVSERMAALGEMAARVAHEIRNPLISIGGFARRLEKKVSGDHREYVSIIVEEVSRLEGILKDILGFVRATKITKKKVNINEIVDNTINFVTHEVLEKGNTLIKDLPPSAIMTTMDPQRIKEAILNVITNANQATDLGVVSVRTGQEGKEAFIEISDTGCGIKQDDLKNIFNPFFTTRPHGTGLGLAITNRIVQEHDGRITVESVWGGDRDVDDRGYLTGQGGTTFKIYLPLEEA